MSGEVEQGQDQGLHAGQRLGVKEDAVLAEAVGDGPPDRPEEQDRKGLQGDHQTDLEPGLGPGEHQPRLGNALHPGPDQRQALTREVIAEVADA